MNSILNHISHQPRECGDGVADGALVEAPELDGELADLGPPRALHQAAQPPSPAHEVVGQSHPTDPVRDVKSNWTSCIVFTLFTNNEPTVSHYPFLAETSSGIFSLEAFHI